MDLLLRDRTVIITGGSSGIGKAAAQFLSKAGATVIICDRKKTYRKDGCRRKAYPFEFIRGDVRDQNTIGRCLQTLPGGRLDTLILCAAVSPLEEKPLEIVEVNYRAAMACILACRPALGRWSSIVLFSSTAAYRIQWDKRWKRLVDEPFDTSDVAYLWTEVGKMPAQRAYALSKWGILQATTRLSRELASEKIRVNCVVPGPTKTAMSRPLWQGNTEKWKRIVNEGPFGRPCTAEEVGATVGLLASPLSAMVTGSFLHVDGGWYAVHRRS